MDFLSSIVAHADYHVDRLVPDMAFIANVHVKSIKEDNWIDQFQRADLLNRDLVQESICHGRARVCRNVNAVEFPHMTDDLMGAHAAHTWR